MPDTADLRIIEDTPKAVSRRRFIKGVIAGGAAVSSANYLFRASALLGQGSGAGERLITINVNGQQRRVDVMKQETLAWTLEQPTRLQILKGESPFSVNCLYRTDSISGACGGNEARYARM